MRVKASQGRFEGNSIRFCNPPTLGLMLLFWQRRVFFSAMVKIGLESIQARCVRRCERSSTIVFKPCYAACISNPNFTWNTEHLGMTCKAQLAMRSTFERNLPKLPTQWKVSLRSNLPHPIGVRSRTVSHKCSEHCTSTLDPVLKTAKSSSMLIFLKSLL